MTSMKSTIRYVRICPHMSSTRWPDHAQGPATSGCSSATHVPRSSVRSAPGCLCRRGRRGSPENPGIACARSCGAWLHGCIAWAGMGSHTLPTLSFLRSSRPLAQFTLRRAEYVLRTCTPAHLRTYAPTHLHARTHTRTRTHPGAQVPKCPRSILAWASCERTANEPRTTGDPACPRASQPRPVVCAAFLFALRIKQGSIDSPSTLPIISPSPAPPFFLFPLRSCSPLRPTPFVLPIAQRDNGEVCSSPYTPPACPNASHTQFSSHPVFF